MDLITLSERIGYTFKKEELLTTALTHSSAVKSKEDYERLEYLGDALLDFIIAEFLIEIHPSAKEGVLSKLRASLVSTQSLAGLADKLEIEGAIVISESAKDNKSGMVSDAVKADVVEAVFGAMYLDSDFDTARLVIRKLFLPLVKTASIEDPKTDLQELLHVLGLPPAVYNVSKITGPQHALNFTVKVTIDDKDYGEGSGSSKKNAEREAAKMALNKLREESQDKKS